MPIEIRELIIRVEATPTSKAPQQPRIPRPVREPVDEAALVERCVQVVLRVLREREER